MLVSKNTKLLLTGTVITTSLLCNPLAHAKTLFTPHYNHKAPSSLIVTIAENQAQLDQAEKFIQSIATKGIEFLSNPDLSQSGKIKRFKQLIRSDFDLKKIGKYALGRYWRSTTPEQQQEYLIEFEKMVLNVYSERFKEYTDQEINVDSSYNKGKSIVVNSKIISKSGPNIKLDWVIRPKGKDFKVIDVLVEGVSMAITQRSDFSSVIQRGGGKIDVLLEHLKKQNNKVSSAKN